MYSVKLNKQRTQKCQQRTQNVTLYALTTIVTLYCGARTGHARAARAHHRSPDPRHHLMPSSPRASTTACKENTQQMNAMAAWYVDVCVTTSPAVTGPRKLPSWKLEPVTPATRSATPSTFSRPLALSSAGYIGT
mmetsp:Transcript_7801/g.12298  ORF Transcript_7801/g.12298 Transcript_7801/m.12298 type:complete len:135 (-) Transcript_7801:417-821(-)